MKKHEFVHLHLHSEYSQLDGAIQFSPLFEKVVEQRASAIAITDHGAMFGAMEFFHKSVKAGIKPILGCEVYIASGSRSDRGTASYSSSRSNHLVLLAQNNKGYQNLCKLVTSGYTEGYYYKPRIDKELLAECSDGLIALSSCLQGEIPNLLVNDKIDEARKAAGFYKDIFPDRFYLELQDHGMEIEEKVNKRMIHLAKEMGLPLVATNNAHYLNREDADAHDALLCIGSDMLLKDKNRIRYHGDQYYVKSADEMAELFRETPEAITNTLVISEQCNFYFDKSEDHWPKFPMPGDTMTETYLEQLATHELDQRFIRAGKAGEPFSAEKKKDYKKRLQLELNTINKMGFSDCFLIMWDFIQYARAQKIPVGPGRDSTAGSMVAYIIGITSLDPIEYDLIFEKFLNFERFLNLESIWTPNLYIDFCFDRRDEIADYISKKYGDQSHVAPIIAFETMKAKMVIREVARVMDIPYDQADKIANLIPNEFFMTIRRSLSVEPRLKKLADESEEIKKLLAISESLEGIVCHASTHSSGVVISPEPLTNFMPLFKTNTISGDVITQYQEMDIERLRLLKMEIIGLPALTVIDNTVKQVRTDYDPDFDIGSIPLDDNKTFNLLREAKTLGVFLLESAGMCDLIRKVKPRIFHDIIALAALYRPGPIHFGMADQYARRKAGKEKWEVEFPELEPILNETYGVLIYQEQVMKIANVLAGFTLGQADTLRKTMGKKDFITMPKMKNIFIAGSINNGHNKTKVEKLWDFLEEYGEYGFNKSHAACYALITYQTAYLKANYPAEYMRELISSEKDRPEKVARYKKELSKMSSDA